MLPAWAFLSSALWIFKGNILGGGGEINNVGWKGRRKEEGGRRWGVLCAVLTLLLAYHTIASNLPARRSMGNDAGQVGVWGWARRGGGGGTRVYV